MPTDQAPKPERVYKAGDRVLWPVIEGLNQMQPWIIASVAGDKVFLRGTLVEKDGKVLGTADDEELTDESIKMESKIVSLKELREYNK